MSEERDLSKIALLDDAIGLIVVIVAIAAVLELSFSYAYALEILSIGLLAIGVAWVVWSFYIIRTNFYARIFLFITGLNTIVISVVDFLFFTVPPESLIFYPATAMILIGVSRIVLGVLFSEIPLWIQMLWIMTGILSINLAAFVFIFPNIDFSAMLIFMVIAFLANGLVRLIVGRTEFKKRLLKPTEVSAEDSTDISTNP
ncbi:MAG: hypothetical protein ACFFE3_01525 [Candidatus Thorarchaeota archaeon]